jgi:hypothetical protein
MNVPESYLGSPFPAFRRGRGTGSELRRRVPVAFAIAQASTGVAHSTREFAAVGSSARVSTHDAIFDPGKGAAVAGRGAAAG